MQGDKPGHFLNPVGCFKKILGVDRPVENLVKLFDVADTLFLHHRIEFFFEDFPWNQHFIWGKGIMEGKSCAIFNGFCNTIFIKVALIVFFPEDLEGPFAVQDFVNGSAREAEVRGIGKGSHQVIAQVSGGCTVSFVDQHEDGSPGVNIFWDAFELVNHRNDETPVVALEEFLQVRFAFGDFVTLKSISFKVQEKLAFKLVSIHQHDDGRFLKLRLPDKSLGRDNHRKCLSRSLRVPNEARFFLPLRRSFDNLLNCS